MSDYEPPMPIMKAVAASISQNTEQNVRTRDEQIDALAKAIGPEKIYRLLSDEYRAEINACAKRHILEAEARGAAKEREVARKGHTPFGWADKTEMRVNMPFACWPKPPSNDPRLTIPLFTRPANVAALEARIAELTEAEQLARADAEASKARVKVLEVENNTLKTRVINAAENLLSIETPCMKGDNFAVTICSYFEDCEGETCDNGWHEGATKAYEEIKDAVLQHFRAALTREGGV